MVSMLFLVVLVTLVLIISIFIAKHFHGKFYLIFIILLLLFFYISATKVINSNNIDVKSVNGMVTAGKAYFRWVGHVISNTKTIVGEAVRMDWGA